MSDWGLFDMRTALAAVAERAAGLPVATLGHSVGGQFLGLLTNHSLARAHVQIATSVGYWPWEQAPFKYLAWWFWRVHGPLMLAIRGYVPTGGGWSGLPLPRGVFEEWRRWCLRPDHFGPDLHTYLTDNVFAEIRAPVLNVGFSDDPIATRRTVAGAQQVLSASAARIALVHAGGRGQHPHRPRGIFRLAPSRHPVAPGDGLAGCETRGRLMNHGAAVGSRHALRSHGAQRSDAGRAARRTRTPRRTGGVLRRRSCTPTS